MPGRDRSTSIPPGVFRHAATDADPLWREYVARHPDMSPGFRLAVENHLGSAFATSIFWGEEFRLFYNAPYARMIENRHPMAYGKPSAQTSPENWDEIQPLLRGVLDGGEAIYRDDFYLARDRGLGLDERYYSFSMSRISDGSGAYGVLCTAMETTSSVLHVRAANERIAELSEFQKLADNITDIVYMHGSDAAIAWANERWYSFTGLTRESSLSLEMWANIMLREDLVKYVRMLERALPAREPYELEAHLKSSRDTDGYRLHFIRATPMFDDDGFILRWAASATDIHDRREAENASRKQLELDRDREHRASLAFQDAAMAKTLPNVQGLKFSAVYEPAGANSLVGGDWYDAFSLSDGRIVLSVGDVMGSGLAAAVTMSGVRQTIRGAAQIYPHPASVLDAADRALRAEQPDRIVTAFLAVLDPVMLNLTFASAGHPAPMLRLPSGEIVELLAPDLPLGLREMNGNAPISQITIPIGSKLVMFTDGLTETTKDIFEGETLLREALSHADGIPAAGLAQHIRDTVVKSSNDDVAILTVTFEESESCHAAGTFGSRARWSFPIVEARTSLAVRHDIAATLVRLGATAEEAGDAEIVIGELLGNVMRHAKGVVQVVLDLTGQMPVLHVLDDGPGFTFYARLPRDEMAESGRGLYIASRLTRDLNVAPRSEGGSHARAVFCVDRLHR